MSPQSRGEDMATQVDKLRMFWSDLGVGGWATANKFDNRNSSLQVDHSLCVDFRLQILR